MIDENITMKECAEQHVHWSTLHMKFFMETIRDISSEGFEDEWEIATQNSEEYWKFGLETWGREFSFAVYDEQEKRR